MKVLKRIGLVVLGLFLAAVVLFFISKPWYYRLFYPWDRITGSISLEIDGKPCSISKESVTAFDGSDREKIRVTAKGESTTISIHAGDYGEYSFMMAVEGVSQPLEIVCYQYNWWNVCDFNLEISVDHKSNSISFHSVSSVLNEEGQNVPEVHSLTLNLSDEVLRFAVVSV